MRAKDKLMSTKLVTFSKYKHNKSMFIILDILKSIQYRDKLYKQLQLKNPNTSNNGIINIHLNTRKFYFENRCNLFKNNI